MTPTLRAFVSTYRPPIQPEPFFGFFEEPLPPDKRRWKKHKPRKEKAISKIDTNYRKHYDHNVLGAKPKNYKRKAA